MNASQIEKNVTALVENFQQRRVHIRITCSLWYFKNIYYTFKERGF